MRTNYESPSACLIKFEMTDVVASSGCVKHDYQYDQVINGVPCDDFEGVRTDDHV